LATPDRMKFSALFATAALASVFAFNAHAQTPATKVDLNKGAALYAAQCVACHAADGNSTTPANPKLAGQHPEYLIKQLQEFKSGKRENAIMSGFASAMSDEDMRNVAFWLASQKPKDGFATDKDLVRLGERIYRGGIANRQIAACAGCHSPNGAGIPAQYPRLAGQHADYTVAQMKAFRDHGNKGRDEKAGRGNSTQMAQIAAQMSDREIKAVADYIAGLR
jgi:cytochrome c553